MGKNQQVPWWKRDRFKANVIFTMQIVATMMPAVLISATAVATDANVYIGEPEFKCKFKKTYFQGAVAMLVLIPLGVFFLGLATPEQGRYAHRIQRI